jgi:uncharacterized membrane protein YdjX (TVP38/TMEM64 family)
MTQPSDSQAPEQGGGKKGFSPMKLLPVALLVIGLIAAYQFGVLDYLSFESLRDNRAFLQDWVATQGLVAGLTFMAIYAIAVALSLPAGAPLTISGGFLFGAVFGTTYVVTGATIGAVILFLAARYAFYDLLHAKAGNAIRKMEDGFKEDALSYLLVLRLVPLFPFWLVNLVPAFLGVKLRTYTLGTFFGIIPGTLVYVSIGDGLGAVFDRGEVPDLSVIFEPRIITPIVGLAVLAMIPVVYKRIKAKKAAQG